jgi:hypothetical protein
VLFARYAYPPNHLGYCGPDDAPGFFHSGVTGDDHGVRVRARDFDGALPHPQLIADAIDRSDPPDILDPRVVEAYWLGNAALDKVSIESVPPTIAAAFTGTCGPLFTDLPEALTAGALPHHSFVVFCIYPWVGMVGDPRRTPQAMRVLDRCRIRSGRVRSIENDHALVDCAPLVWDGDKITVGPVVLENARTGIDGVGLSTAISVGDQVALHWDWVCDVINDEQRALLDGYTARHLALVNSALAERRLTAAGHG